MLDRNLLQNAVKLVGSHADIFGEPQLIQLLEVYRVTLLRRRRLFISGGLEGSHFHGLLFILLDQLAIRNQSHRLQHTCSLICLFYTIVKMHLASITLFEELVTLGAKARLKSIV